MSEDPPASDAADVESALPATGYELLRVYAVRQQYGLRIGETHPSGKRQLKFGWDWRPAGPRTFNVAISVELGPSQEQPEEAVVQLSGTFRAARDGLGVPFEDFVRLNATAILFPFVREALAQITARGPYGPFLLLPVHVGTLAQSINTAGATGLRDLRDNPARAQDFGLLAAPGG